MAIAVSEQGRRGWPWRLADRTNRRKLASFVGLGLAISAPICVLVTYLLATGSGPFEDNPAALRIMIVVDFVLAIALLAIVAWKIAALVIARRARSAGSRLHIRMVRLFTILAVAPALFLGLLAAFIVTFTLEGWLNSSVGGVVQNSVRIAEIYVRERHQAIRLDAAAVGQELARATPFGVLDPQRLSQALARASAARGAVEVFVINSSGDIIARGPNSYLFLFEPPDPRHLAQTRDGEVYVYEDEIQGAVRALAPLDGIFDAYIYISRPVDGEAARFLAQTRQEAARYEEMAARRGDIQLSFAMLYVGFALLLLLAAIWFGIWFADRLARPIGRLAGAADRVAKGDLGARVEEERGTDEIATLSRAFNRMTTQVERQRDALLTANGELDHRRRFTEAILSGVTVGVIGMDANGRIDLTNSTAETYLDQRLPQTLEELDLLLPGAAALCASAGSADRGLAEDRLVQVTENGMHDYLARAACQRGPNGAIDGYVLTLDEMTALVAAQRSAAWGDVARRVAHEIRNPLTPIQLSAERLKRKFSSQIDSNRESFDTCVETIARQVGQIRRMVDEFSNFARMPVPEFGSHSVDAIIDEMMTVTQAGFPDVSILLISEATGQSCECDRGLIVQALTNLARNGAQSVRTRLSGEDNDGQAGLLRVAAQIEGTDLIVTIRDNGAGLPVRDRERLTEPYISHRVGGTGLGLAIVGRIADEHGGSLDLQDDTDGQGAIATLRLPLGQKDRSAARGAAA